jgi:hypothetical protein
MHKPLLLLRGTKIYTVLSELAIQHRAVCSLDKMLQLATTINKAAKIQNYWFKNISNIAYSST